MPLRLNAGLSKKIGEQNYGSKGASVNVQMELDSSLIQEPAKLKERIAQLFTLVRSSLNDELNGNGNGHSPGNGKANGQAAQPAATSAPKVRPATQSQVRAIQTICRDKDINLTGLLSGYGVAKAEELNIKQASEAIDKLKK
jgi:hypothetical protein